MAVRLSDEQIAELISGSKSSPDVDALLGKLKPASGHLRADVPVAAEGGREFRLKLRQSQEDLLDFSVILVYHMPDSNKQFRLQRHNGSSHQHRNRIEHTTIDYHFHRHKATERYQLLGAREDGYAEVADDFYDLRSALRRILEQCSFEIPHSPQLKLFEES